MLTIQRTTRTPRGTNLVLSLLLAGLTPGCLKPLPATTATTATGGATSSTSSGNPESTSTGAPTTTSTGGASTTGTTTISGSTTYGDLQPMECDEDEIYICRLDASGQCGEDSSCEYGPSCELGECSQECEYECSLGWDCVDAGTSEMLVCSPNYDEDCSLFRPDDCPEGTKCMPWASEGGSSWNARKCAPLDPNPVGPGEVCTTEDGVSGIDNCDADSMCWDVDSETREGTCIAFCMGTNGEDASCAPGFGCTITADAILALCLPDCDPLAQDCSGDDECIPSGDRFICVLDASGEGGFFGDPCEFANACKPGLYCLDPEYVEDCKGTGCCTPFCDTSKPPMCPGATQECIPWFEQGQAPPGSEDVGICGIPQ